MQQTPQIDENLSSVYAGLVSSFIHRTQVTEVLDYGSGEWFAHLRVGHKLSLQAYDPTNPLLAARPSPTQLVVCLDIDARPGGTLDALQGLVSELGLFAFTGGARDWLPALMARWTLETVQHLPTGYMVIVSAADEPTSRIYVPN